MSSQMESTVLRKVTNRLVWFICALYFLSFLDRANVGIAALGMNQDLKFSATVYGLGAGLFFISYAIFEIPSNLILHRVGARMWIARIMITWGIISTCMMFVQGPYSFYALRFLLGAAEAGFSPGIIYYLTMWYPSEHRGKPYALFLSFAMLALITMGPLSSWVMGATQGLAGLAGWRWMFILEGVPSIILGIVTLFYLEDRLEGVTWLNQEEKTWLRDTLEAEKRKAPPKEHASVGAFMLDGRLWALTWTYFFWGVGNIGIMFWLPTILKSWGKLSNAQVGMLYSLPFVCALAGMHLVGRRSDRTGERKYHIVVCALIAFVALSISTVVSPVPAFILICIAAFNIWGLQPIFWTLPGAYLGGVSAAAGIALINASGGVGGFVGPYLVGWIKDVTGRFPPAIFALALMFLVTAVIVMFIKIDRKSEALPSSVGKSASADRS